MEDITRSPPKKHPFDGRRKSGAQTRHPVIHLNGKAGNTFVTGRYVLKTTPTSPFSTATTNYYERENDQTQHAGYSKYMSFVGGQWRLHEQLEHVGTALGHLKALGGSQDPQSPVGCDRWLVAQEGAWSPLANGQLCCQLPANGISISTVVVETAAGGRWDGGYEQHQSRPWSCGHPLFFKSSSKHNEGSFLYRSGVDGRWNLSDSMEDVFRGNALVRSIEEHADHPAGLDWSVLAFSPSFDLKYEPSPASHSSEFDDFLGTYVKTGQLVNGYPLYENRSSDCNTYLSMHRAAHHGFWCIARSPTDIDNASTSSDNGVLFTSTSSDTPLVDGSGSLSWGYLTKSGSLKNVQPALFSVPTETTNEEETAVCGTDGNSSDYGDRNGGDVSYDALDFDWVASDGKGNDVKGKGGGAMAHADAALISLSDGGTSSHNGGSVSGGGGVDTGKETARNVARVPVSTAPAAAATEAAVLGAGGGESIGGGEGGGAMEDFALPSQPTQERRRFADSLRQLTAAPADKDPDDEGHPLTLSVTAMATASSPFEVVVAVGPDEWSCAQCTFLNPTSAPQCDMCHGPRPAAAAAVVANGRTESLDHHPLPLPHFSLRRSSGGGSGGGSSCGRGSGGSGGGGDVAPLRRGNRQIFQCDLKKDKGTGNSKDQHFQCSTVGLHKLLAVVRKKIAVAPGDGACRTEKSQDLVLELRCPAHPFGNDIKLVGNMTSTAFFTIQGDQRKLSAWWLREQAPAKITTSSSAVRETTYRESPLTILGATGIQASPSLSMTTESLAVTTQHGHKDRCKRRKVTPPFRRTEEVVLHHPSPQVAALWKETRLNYEKAYGTVDYWPQRRAIEVPNPTTTSERDKMERMFEREGEPRGFPSEYCTTRVIGGSKRQKMLETAEGCPPETAKDFATAREAGLKEGEHELVMTCDLEIGTFIPWPSWSRLYNEDLYDSRAAPPVLYNEPSSSASSLTKPCEQPYEFTCSYYGKEIIFAPDVRAPVAYANDIRGADRSSERKKRVAHMQNLKFAIVRDRWNRPYVFLRTITPIKRGDVGYLDYGEFYDWSDGTPPQQSSPIAAADEIETWVEDHDENDTTDVEVYSSSPLSFSSSSLSSSPTIHPASPPPMFRDDGSSVSLAAMRSLMSSSDEITESISSSNDDGATGAYGNGVTLLSAVSSPMLSRRTKKRRPLVKLFATQSQVRGSRETSSDSEDSGGEDNARSQPSGSASTPVIGATSRERTVQKGSEEAYEDTAGTNHDLPGEERGDFVTGAEFECEDNGTSLVARSDSVEFTHSTNKTFFVELPPSSSSSSPSVSSLSSLSSSTGLPPTPVHKPFALCVGKGDVTSFSPSISPVAGNEALGEIVIGGQTLFMLPVTKEEVQHIRQRRAAEEGSAGLVP